MRKVKIFMSLLKERDWLEEMARQGWLLKEMTMGVIYDFEAIEPTEKVYEIDRFTAMKKPQKQMLMARRTALDIAKQAGWEVITHDEDMNYYFVKDKAGDESDEFYDEPQLRLERAEKFRRHIWEMVLDLLKELLALSVLYLLVYILFGTVGASCQALGYVFLGVTLFMTFAMIMALVQGEKWYEELSLSREEWEQRKRLGEKKSFRNTSELVAWLEEKNAQGVALTDYSNKTYLFEESSISYQYAFDTKHALKRRLKEKGKRFRSERKDWMLQSFQWYEMSITEAREQGLELVCVIGTDILVYRRRNEGEDLAKLWNPGIQEAMGFLHKIGRRGRVFLTLMAGSFVVGFLTGMILSMIR